VGVAVGVGVGKILGVGKLVAEGVGELNKDVKKEKIKRINFFI